jgi:hypothetical protein
MSRPRLDTRLERLVGRSFWLRKRGVPSTRVSTDCAIDRKSEGILRVVEHPLAADRLEGLAGTCDGAP